MEHNDLIQGLSKCIPIATGQYSGDYDENFVRNGIGDEQWRREYYQRYKGRFLQNSLHGRGRYSWALDNQKTIYDGFIYANNVEGYGKYSYSDLSVFEGLFKANCRFGPGIFSYTDGTQDVGMWNGNKLMRLCCVVKAEWVPRIAKTPGAKIKLLKYRKLIPVCETNRDRAQCLLESLGANEDVMQQSSKLYNNRIRNPNSRFFNTSLHDRNFFCKKDCYIEVALSPEEQEVLNKEELHNPTPEGDSSTDFNIMADNECLCGDSRQIHLEELRLELEHAEKILARLTEEVLRAKCKKKLAMDKMIDDDKERTKSVGFENIAFIEGSDSTLVIRHATLDDPQDDDDLDDLECELEEEEEVDFRTACQLVAAAKNAEKLALLKKNDLINKLYYVNTRPEGPCNCNDEDKQPKSKKVFITDLLAWNNEESSTEMLKHVFLHRNLEKDVSYCVSDLLVGDRSDFQPSGAYEDACILFLSECSNGNAKEATNLYRQFDFNPDMCDGKGNTGLIYACARDKIKVMQWLINSGANVDVLNDECFTPLGMCVARYLATQQNITDWEKAFLKPTLIENDEELEIFEWRPHVSLTSISNIVIQQRTDRSFENIHSVNFSRQASHVKLEALSELFGSNLDIRQSAILGSISVNDVYHRLRKIIELSHDYQEAYNVTFATTTPQSYVLDTTCIRPPPPPKIAKKAKKSKKSKKSSKSSKKSQTSSEKSGKNKSKSKKSPQISSEQGEDKLEVNQEEIIKLGAIYNTISVLLEYGADPNACEVPHPTLILSIYTKNLNLIEDLLWHKADPNTTTLDENLTALHIIASLPPCEEHIHILKLLLKHLANPNCKTNIHHWVEQKLELQAKYELLQEDQGKTPLQILAMRYDFSLDSNGYINQMVEILMQNGGRVKERYLGHTTLSLAIIRGNLVLIRMLLETKRINPNQSLGENIGVPLTVLVLKRYKDLIPPLEICRDILDLLLEYKANPLDVIDTFGNALEFTIKEHEEPPKAKKGKGKGKKDKKGKAKTKAKPKGKKGKKGKKQQTSHQDVVKQLLGKATKNVLQRHVKGWAVKYLYFFVEEEDYYDEISANMAKFVTPTEAIDITQLLVHRGEIPMTEKTNYYTMYDFIEFIININSKLPKSTSPLSTEVDIDKMLENFEFKQIPKIKGKLNLPEPEVEKHSEKYNVCFHCCRKKGHQLFICPDCNLIYFCSQECNKLNIKEANPLHKCGSIFYDAQKEIHEERLKRGAHWEQTALLRSQIKEAFGGIKLCESDGFGPTRERIGPDPTRKLHLTRDSRKLSFKSILAHIVPQNLTALNLRRKVYKSTSDTRMLRKPDNQYGESILSLRWRAEGSAFLKWKSKSTSGNLQRGVKRGKGQGTKDSSSERTLSKKGEGKRKDKTHAGDSGDDTREGSKAGVGTNGGQHGKTEVKGDGEGEKRHGKGKSGPTRRTSKERNRSSKDKARGGSKDHQMKPNGLDQFGISDVGPGSALPFSYTPIPVGGGRLAEFKRRLPNKYQYFLEKISEFWPDFDLSMLFLPYACYSEGQIYYRFLTNRPLFMETFSKQ